MWLNFGNEIELLIKNAEFSNTKALLQEYTQSLDAQLPEYVLKSECGQSHDKTFTVEVYYSGELLGCGVGKSKKEAEQEAAREALIKKGIIKW